jgi:hypothetical protein
MIFHILSLLFMLTLLSQPMNEPHRGFIDLPSLHGYDYNTDLHLAHVREYTHCPSICVIMNPYRQPLLSNRSCWG